jgi:hypothetical protein
MTPQDKAQAGLRLLKEAALDYLRTRPDGAPASEIREALGIDDANCEGERRGYLLWGLQHFLVQDGQIETNRDCRPQRIMLRR